MNSAEQNLNSLRRALHAELRRHWGLITEVEQRIDKSDGYLRKFCNGAQGMSLEQFLRCLDALEVDAGEFIARALDTVPEPETFLAQLEDERRLVGGWKKIDKAVRELRTEPLVAATPRRRRLGDDTGRIEHLVAALDECGLTEQRRRLRHTVRYHDPAFADAYVAHLDELRHDDPRLAVKLVTPVIVDLLPKLEPTLGRLELLVRGLATYESAHRLIGEHATAVRALRTALSVARGHDLRPLTANLLMRGSYLLKAHGQAERGLLLLREAQEIYLDVGDAEGLAHVQVNRGILFHALDQPERVIELIPKTLDRLRKLPERQTRHELSAHQLLAEAHKRRGELDEAERCLERAVESFDGSEVVAAKLMWQWGNLAAERRDFARAEDLLRHSAEVLGRRESPIQGALVELDRVDALLRAGRPEQACTVAKDMARILELFSHNPVAEAAMLELMRAALASDVTQRLLHEVGQKLRAAAQP